jgi:hypothetical protein
MFYSKLIPAFGGGSVYVTKIWNEKLQRFTLPYEYWASPNDCKNINYRSYSAKET